MITVGNHIATLVIHWWMIIIGCYRPPCSSFLLDPFLLQSHSHSTSSSCTRWWVQAAAREEMKQEFKARATTALQKTARISESTNKKCILKHPSGCPRDTEVPRSRDNLTFLLLASSFLFQKPEQPTQLMSPQFCCSKQEIVQGGCSVLSKTYLQAEIRPIRSLPLASPHFIKSPAVL